MATVTLKNPHSVLAALRHRPSSVIAVRVQRRGISDAWAEVVALADSHRIPIQEPLAETHSARNRADAAGGRMGGNEATVQELQSRPLKGFFQRTESPGLWLALDHVQDPHNLGAILRSAAFFGVRGVVATRDQSAPLTAVVYDVACGGVDSVPLTIIPNLVQAIEQAKEAGLWVLGTSEHAPQKLGQIDRQRDWLLVLGNEEKGLRRLVLEHCDETCCIPPLGGDVLSLNVSVASGVLIAGLTGAIAP
ncbi:MAG: RNA methyltransferase [Planctomycetota bacterium]|nr:MAG: RNA methyltransferase [Planctomycetota bacterium]